MLVHWVLAIAIDNGTGRESYHPTMPVSAILRNSVTGKYTLYTWNAAKDSSTLEHHIFYFRCAKFLGIEEYYVLNWKP
jgi:hypothetical protein